MSYYLLLLLATTNDYITLVGVVRCDAARLINIPFFLRGVNEVVVLDDFNNVIGLILLSKGEL
jgi:hypothetical protein